MSMRGKKNSRAEKYELKKFHIIKAYRLGKSFDEICRLNELPPRSRQTITKRLKEWGVFDPKRTSKNAAKRIEAVNAKRWSGYRIKAKMARWTYDQEWRGAWRWDDNHHWRNYVKLDKSEDEIERLRLAANATAKRTHERNKFNPVYRIVKAMRVRTWKVIKLQYSLKRKSWTRDLIGCDRQTLMNHFQSQFTGLMSFDNYGTLWEVDHKRPCVTFDLSDESQQRECFHYSNLQPMLKKENRTKQSMWNGVMVRRKKVTNIFRHSNPHVWRNIR